MENLETLFKRLSQGDLSVREEIIQANMPLVYSIAKKYFSYIDKDVAIQEGCIGLIQAVDKFDVNKGYKFSTYATYHIDGAIKRYITDYNENNSIRIKRDDNYLLVKINKAISILRDELQREPSSKDLASYLQVDEDKINLVLSLQNTLSLDYEMNNPKSNNNSTLHEVVRDTSIDIEDISINNILVEKALSILTSRERLLIEKRYIEDLTQKEIGKVLGISQAQVSRLETKILKKMKKCIENKAIQENKKGDIKMSKNLADLNNMLFEQLEKISNPNLKGKSLKEEIERSQAISKLASQIISNGSLVLKVKSMSDTSKKVIESKPAPMLDTTPSKE